MRHPIEADKPLVEFMRYYHRYEIRGLEILDPLVASGRPFFLVGNHGFNFIEPALLLHSVYNAHRRVPRIVGHKDLFFKIKEVGEIARRYGIVSHLDFRAIHDAIKKGKSLLIYPGGEDEAMLRDYHKNPYKLIWENRPGFAKLAVKYSMPIVFVASIGVDEMVFQGNMELPSWVIRQLNMTNSDNYERVKMFWNGAFPAPVKITHIITEPIELFGEDEDMKRNEYVRYKLSWLQKTCQKRLDSALTFQDSAMSDPLDKAVKAIQSFARTLGIA